jgi:FkbM family methyltransferase
MARVFLDVGALDGSSVKFFRDNHPESNQFEIYSFEPFPENIRKLEQVRPKVHVIPKAAWSSDGEVTMYVGKPKSGTMYADKATGLVDAKNKITVPTIDFAKFILDHFKKEDEIWLKLNVEGAEYEIIPHLHYYGLIPWFDRMFIMWHARKIPSLQSKHDAVVALVPQATDIWRKQYMLPLV